MELVEPRGPLAQSSVTVYVFICMWCKLGDNRVILTAPRSPPRDMRARPVSSSTVVVQWHEPQFSNGVIKVRKALNHS